MNTLFDKWRSLSMTGKYVVFCVGFSLLAGFVYAASGGMA